MKPSSSNDVTRLLVDWSNGDANALDQLLPLIYDELHQLAQSFMRRERPDHTLQPTALVHEAYLGLVDQRRVTWQNRAHFFAVASKVMRRVALKHARSRNAQKRGGGALKVPLGDIAATTEQRAADLLALDEALVRLEAIDSRQSQIVELRFFGGLTVEEIAEVLGTSVATVKRDWRTSRAWLLCELEDV